MTGVLDTIKAHWEVRKFKRSPLGQALRHHTRRYFYSGEALSWMKEENKEKFIQDFLAKLAGIVGAPDPIMALRTALVEYILLYADLSMLCLTESEKEAMFYSANPFITGEIHHQVMEAAKHVEEAATYIWQYGPVEAEEMISFGNTRSAIMLFYANGLNMCRIDMGDDDPAKDWFRPFVEAALVTSEDRMREKLGLPRLVPGPIHSLPYAIFFEHILAGERNPFFKWTQEWPDLYLAGEGPLPVIDDNVR